MIQIESNIPRTNRFHGMTKELIEAFEKMKSGDSFLYPKANLPAIQRAIHIYKKVFDATAKFSKGESATNPEKIRIWKR